MVFLACLWGQPAIDQALQEGGTDHQFSVVVCTKPRIFFSPVVVIPNAMTIMSAAKVSPSSTSATNTSRSSRRSHKVCRGRALARMNGRDPLDALSPKASGTASAQAAELWKLSAAALAEQPGIRSPGGPHAFVGLEWSFLTAWQIPHARVRDWQFLIREVDGALLAAPPHQTSLPTCPAVPLPGQRSHLGVQRVRDGVQAQRNECLNQGHGPVQVVCGR